MITGRVYLGGDKFHGRDFFSDADEALWWVLGPDPTRRPASGRFPAVSTRWPASRLSATYSGLLPVSITVRRVVERPLLPMSVAMCRARGQWLCLRDQAR